MTRSTSILLLSLVVAAGAHAQSSVGAVTTSTDPAKIAAIEKRAQELQARPAQAPQAMPAAKQAGKAKPATAQPHSAAKPAAKSSTKSGSKSSAKTAVKPKA